MSNRHFLTIKKGSEDLHRVQILGNNDYFDEEFYNHMGMVVDEDGYCDPVELYVGNTLDGYELVDKFFLDYQRYLVRRFTDNNKVGLKGIVDDIEYYYSGNATDQDILTTLATTSWDLNIDHRLQYLACRSVVYTKGTGDITLTLEVG